MTDEKHTPKADGSPQEVDRIRDIIFGSQMRSYEGQFTTLQRDLERLQQEIAQLNEKLTEQENSHNTRLQALQREMHKAVDALRDESRQASLKLSDEKVDRAVLGDLLIELGGHLKAGGTFTGTLKDLLEPKKEPES